MNAYREMISLSRELARQAREQGIHIRALQLIDATREAEAQLARDENDRDNLRHLLSELFTPAPEARCSSCGNVRHLEGLQEVLQRRSAAERHLRRLLARLGGPIAGSLDPVVVHREATAMVAKAVNAPLDQLRTAIRNARDHVETALEATPDVPTIPQSASATPPKT